MTRLVKAAVVQAGSVPFDTPATIAKLQRLAADPACSGADLIVFPEAFVGGYPKGMDFGARLGWRTPAGRDDYLRYAQGSIVVPGPETDAIGDAARIANAHLVTGVIERAGHTLYCTALTFGPDGTLLGARRKLMPTGLERLIWGFGDGSTVKPVDSAIGPIGAVICWENYMPLLRAAFYAQGVEFYCAPTVDDREIWVPTMRTIAVEGRCFVLSACQYLVAVDGSRAADTAQALDPLIRGGSCIVGPLGDILAGPVYGEETILTATLDRDDIVRGKYDLDVAGHYGRPDILSLLLDTRPKSVLTTER
jgi:nitrilase